MRADHRGSGRRALSPQEESALTDLLNGGRRTHYTCPIMLGLRKQGLVHWHFGFKSWCLTR